MLDGDIDNDPPLAWTWAHDSTHFWASGPAGADWSIGVPNGDSRPLGLLEWAIERDALRCGAIAMGCMIRSEMAVKVKGERSCRRGGKEGSKAGSRAGDLCA